MLNTDFRFPLFILLHHSGVDFHSIWNLNIFELSWVKSFLAQAVLEKKMGLIVNSAFDP